MKITKRPSPFAQRVYELTRKIPAGKVSTYKAIGQALNTKAYRAIGQVLRCNPYAPEVPCHRVVASDGSLGGFRGDTQGSSIHEKIVLLRNEGVAVVGNRIENLDMIHHSF